MCHVLGFSISLGSSVVFCVKTLGRNETFSQLQNDSSNLPLLQVTLIPTHDTEVTRDWYQQTHEKQQELNVMVLASSSTVVMQDESFPACKIEF